MHHAPGPMLAVQPTVELAKRNSRQRIDPLIEESPELRERVLSLARGTELRRRRRGQRHHHGTRRSAFPAVPDAGGGRHRPRGVARAEGHVMAFHEVRFPDNISRGARGGPERRTQIVELASGDEERNASWANSRRLSTSPTASAARTISRRSSPSSRRATVACTAFGSRTGATTSPACLRARHRPLISRSVPATARRPPSSW